MVCSISNVMTLLLWIPVSSTYGQTCAPNKYGTPQCQYDCHCASGVVCDPETGCSNVRQSQKCAPGWDGTTCQRENVALKRSAKQSSLYCEGDKCFRPANAVDGILGHIFFTTDCTHTLGGRGMKWSATLGKTYGIYSFTIYNRGGYGGGKYYGSRLNGFQLSVGRTSDSGNNYRLCYQDNTASDRGPGDVITRTCNSSIDGDIVQIKLPDDTLQVLTLCEVLIYVCSPGWYGEMCNKECASADKCFRCTANQLECAECISGKWGTDCNSTCGSCWNSNQCDKENSVCPKTASDKYRCSAGFKDDRCIQDCTAGLYGPDCLEPCGFCRAVSPICASDTGVCPMTAGTRCSDGYRGDLCKEKCLPGNFGRNCSDQCGHCAGGQDKCMNTNGRCSNTSNPRCAAGYTGDICKTVCSPGRYGGDCSETCGQCAAGNQSCAKDSGVCPQNSGSPRCSPEYKGDQCKDSCDVGEYGVDCSSKCGMCLGGPQECDTRNGTCLDGCADGFTGYTCQTDSQTSRPAVEAIVGGAVAAVVAAMLIAILIVIIIKLRRNSPKELEEPENELSPVAALPNVVQRGRDGVYSNVPACNGDHTTVTADELGAYVRSKRADDKLSAEYEGLPKGLQANCEVAKKAENKGKSRYQNIVAYDHSRVVLDPLDDDPHSDYINACYIHGYKEMNKYVASQGPTGIIVNDFWRTIWQVNTGKVVMLTNLMEDLKKKCELYWPISVSDVSEFGLIRVMLFHEDVCADFTVRTLRVTNKKHPKQTKEIKQFHFTAWPDHGVPTQATGLLNFLDKVNRTTSKLTGPVVIHCSAGIGRTGTFIGLDYLIKQANEDGVVDVPACVRLIREQRTNMIQTVGQYEFLYDALIEAIEMSYCSVPGAEFPSVYRDLCAVNPATGQTKIQKQFDALKDLSSVLKTADLKNATDPVNLPKSRNPSILAADSVRPFLSTPVSGCNNYINAVFLPAYKKKRAFIITQMPLPGTIIDFWRLIHEQDVRTVIMLDTAEITGKDVGTYWPEGSAQYGPFDVDTLEVEDGHSFLIRNLSFQYKKETQKDNANIKQFLCTFWKEDTVVPRSSRSLITLIEEVERWQQESGNGPIIVHCMDGATKSGLYCAVSSIIERLKVDQEVNILQTLKQMRFNRPEIVQNLEQFQFIHEVVLDYLDSFHTYANFQ